QETCFERADHFLWILHVTGGFLSLLKHCFAKARPSLSSSQRHRSNYSRDIWRLQGYLAICKSLLKADETLEFGPSRLHPWIAMKVSILYQLLEFYVQNYWFLNTNGDCEQAEEVLDSLRDVLTQLIKLLPRVLPVNIIGAR